MPVKDTKDLVLIRLDRCSVDSRRIDSELVDTQSVEPEKRPIRHSSWARHNPLTRIVNPNRELQ